MILVYERFMMEDTEMGKGSSRKNKRNMDRKFMGQNARKQIKPYIDPAVRKEDKQVMKGEGNKRS